MRGRIRIRGTWGPFSKIYIHGGPWLKKPKGFYGICMAPEVLAGHDERFYAVPEPDIAVDVRDFSTPDPDTARLAALCGLQAALLGGRDVYVGCGFGVGRTGTMLGLMARIAKPWLTHPVEFVRRTYFGLAIETPEQREMVETLDVSEAQKLYQQWLWRRRWLLPHGYVIPERAWKS
jgi:hypothetical protein